MPPPALHGAQAVRRCPECGHAVKGDKPARLCRTCENKLCAALKSLLGVGGPGYFLLPW